MVITSEKPLLGFVIIDIDGTAIAGNPWFMLTRYFSAPGKDIENLNKHKQLFYAYKENPSPEAHREMSRQLIAIWNEGATEKITPELLRKIFAKEIALRPGVKELITELLENQWLPVFMTGGMELVAEYLVSITDLAKVEDLKTGWGNSVFEVDETGEIIGFEYTLDEAGLKVEQAAELLNTILVGGMVAPGVVLDMIALSEGQIVFPPDLFVFVGDGSSDLGLFDQNGLKIAFGEEASKEIIDASDHRVFNFNQLNLLLQELNFIN